MRRLRGLGLRDMAPDFGFVEEFYVGTENDLYGDLRIVWKVCYDEWEWALRREVLD